MDGNYVSRHEHEEFRRSMESENKRLEEENDRQNHCLNALEETVKQVAAISTSVEKLALNMENMLKEQVFMDSVWRRWKTEMEECGERQWAMSSLLSSTFQDAGGLNYGHQNKPSCQEDRRTS